MKNIDFIIRKDGENKEISKDNDNSIDIPELLEKEYNYLYKSLKEDKFNLRTNKCDFFKELVYKEKVVGFVTYNIISKCQYTLTNIFILAGYRRHRLLYKELKHHLTKDINLIILEPSRHVVEALIRYRWAKKITKNLVISAINFNINLSSAISNNEKKSNSLALTNIYDLDICATLSFKIFNREKYELCYTQVVEEDKRFNCEEKREKIDQSYFDNCVTELIARDSEIERWLFVLNKHLPSKPIDTEEIIGKPTHFSQTLQESIDDGIITTKEAKIIQNQLFVELRMGKVEKEALELRLDYLINNYHEKTVKNNTTEHFCPYCYEDVDYLENYCINCGYTLYSLSSLDEEDFVYKQLLEEKHSYKHSLTGKRELKNYHDEEYLIGAAIGLVISNLDDGLFGEDLFDFVASKYGIIHIDLEQIMIDRGYITYKMNPQKWENEAYNFKNVELKEILKQHNCKVSGNKYDLIQRISKEVPLEDIPSDIPSLTEKGIKYTDEKADLLFHNAALNDYIYDEFREFMDENRDKKYNYGPAIDFLDKHIDYAKKTRNHDQLVDSLRVKAFLFNEVELYDELLETELEIFLINLNMVFVDSHYYQYYKPVDKSSWFVLNKMQEMFTDESFGDAFDLVFKSFDENDLKVSLYDTVDCLKDILKHYNLNAINRKIMHKYYRILKYKKIDVGILDINDNTRTTTTLDSFFN